MEIILMKDIDTLGLANSIVDVKPGYARNYLIPRGMAIAATPRNKNILMQKIRQQEQRAAQLLQDAKALAAKLSETTLRIVAKAGTSGKIFGSVTNIQIAQAIKDTLGIELERKQVLMPDEVKSLGNYTAEIQLHKDVRASINFEVFEEKKQTEEEA
jgi:large subunit ribosomal protein L9